MPDHRANQTKPPRGKYAAIMAVTTVLAMASASGVAAMMGAPGRAAILAALSVMAGSLATFIPAILRVERQSWGLAVLGSSMARTIVILAVALAIDKSRDLGDARTAFWIGTMIGTGVVLLIESAVSIRILAAMERSASASRGSGPSPAPQA